jgi:outer membrane immunogenic protein
VFGGGVEAMFSPSWSAKLEYLYVDLGRTNVPISGFATNVDIWSTYCASA